MLHAAFCKLHESNHLRRADSRRSQSAFFGTKLAPLYKRQRTSKTLFMGEKRLGDRP
jgi:hypothetical protein